MKREVVIMNFTHIYEQQKFTSNPLFKWIDCTHIDGVKGFCDEQSVGLLTELIKDYSPEGIHFIDSGNYHYMSKLWCDKIKEPFSLVVFDHHPDMQPSLFANLLSCGCWVKSLLDTNPFIHKVFIVGASRQLVRQVEDKYTDRIVFYDDDSLMLEDTWRDFSSIHVREPLYISVDKDVLSRNYVETDWDQGSMTLEQLEKLLSIILRKQQIIGVDICGECSSSLDLFHLSYEEMVNNHANEEIVKLILKKGID